MYPEELWNTYSAELKSYIMKHVSDKHEAQDILQEVGVRLYQNTIRIKEVTNIKAWLFRVAYNLIVDHYREVSKYLLIGDIGEISVPDTFENENFNNETAECLLKLVECLPLKDKEAIIESDYKGTKQSILSQKWGLSNSGGKTRVQRARKKLKAILFKCCEVKSDKTGNIIEIHQSDNTQNELSCIKC